MAVDGGRDTGRGSDRCEATTIDASQDEVVCLPSAFGGHSVSLVNGRAAPPPPRSWSGADGSARLPAATASLSFPGMRRRRLARAAGPTGLTKRAQLHLVALRDRRHAPRRRRLHAMPGGTRPRARPGQASHAVPACILADPGRLRARRHRHGDADIRRLPVALDSFQGHLQVRRRQPRSQDLRAQGWLDQQGLQGVRRSRRRPLAARRPRHGLRQGRDRALRIPAGRPRVVPEPERGPRRIRVGRPRRGDRRGRAALSCHGARRQVPRQGRRRSHQPHRFHPRRRQGWVLAGRPDGDCALARRQGRDLRHRGAEIERRPARRREPRRGSRRNAVGRHPRRRARPRARAARERQLQALRHADVRWKSGGGIRDDLRPRRQSLGRHPRQGALSHPWRRRRALRTCRRIVERHGEPPVRRPGRNPLGRHHQRTGQLPRSARDHLLVGRGAGQGCGHGSPGRPRRDDLGRQRRLPRPHRRRARVVHPHRRGSAGAPGHLLARGPHRPFVGGRR